MIFKTFNNDIDSSIYKIGVFDKSFGNIIDKINQRQMDINGLKRNNNMSDKDAKKQVGSIWSYLGKDEHKDALTDEFTAFKELMEETGLGADELAKQVGGVSKSVLDYAKSDDTAKLSTEGFKASIGNLSIGAKAGQVALKGLALAGNMVVGILAGFVISKAIEGLDNYIHRVENAKKTLDEFNSSVKEQQEDLSSQESWISENGKRFEELSKGVDEYGHNISLTTDEFSEYKDMTAKIAEMFPTMIQGYNDQNDVILKNKGSVEELTKAYEDNKKAYYADIRSKSSDTFNDFKTAISDDVKNSNELDKVINGKFKSAGMSADSTGTPSIIVDGKEINYSKLEEILGEENAIDLTSQIYGGVESFDDLTPELQQKIRDVYSSLNSTVETESEKVKPILQAYFDTNTSGYDKLSDEAKTDVQLFANNVKGEFLDQFDTDTDMEEWVRKNVIAPLNDGLDSDDLGVITNKLLSPKGDDETISDYENRISTAIDDIKDYCEDKKIDIPFDLDSIKSQASEVKATANSVIEDIEKDVIKNGMGDSSDVKTITNWVNSLTSTELEYAQSDEFQKALIAKQQELGRTSLKAEEYEDVLNSVKSTEEDTASALDGTLDSIKTAFESANASADWTSLADYLKQAKELFDGGFIGTDDFQSVAQWMAPDKIDTSAYEIPANAYADAWKNAYDKVSRWFDSEDETVSVWNFLEDLQKADSSLVDIDKDTGRVETHFSSTAEVAKALGVNVEVIETMMKTLSDYGFELNGVEDSVQKLEEIKGDLSSIQTLYDNMQDGSRKDRLGQLLENWNTQVDGFQNDMSTLQEGFDIPIKFEYDLQQLYDQIDQIKTKIQNGGKAGRDEYANLLGLNEEVIDKLESQTGVDKITDDYFDTLQKGIEEASSAIDEKIKSGNYSDDDIVELQKTLQDRQDAYQQVLQAFNDWGTNNQIDFTTASGEDLQQYWNDFLSEPHELKIDAKIENKDTVDNMLSEMASGSTITFTANVDEVEQTVTAVKDEEGNITYYGDVSDPETQVYYVKDQDGTIYFSGDTDAAVDAVNQTKENVENSQSNFLVGADTSSAIASINAAIIAAHEGRGVIQVDGDLSPFQKTWNKVAGFLNKLGGNVPTFSASTKSTKTVGTKSTGNYSNKRLSMQEARLEQQNRGSSSKNNSSVSKNNKKKNSNVSYLGNSGGAGNKKGNLTSKSSKKPDSSSGKSGSGSGNKGGSGSGSSSEPQEQDYNWIETLISRIQRQVTNLGKTVSATYKSWSTRNNALAQELGAVNNEISVQQQAYNKYMQLANSVSLPENYASLVRNGALDVSTIADDDLNEKIKKYKEYYEAALESADAVTDLQDQLAELAKTKFDSVTSQFEAQLKVIEQEKGMYETFLDETETAGYLASTKYYEYLISTEKKNIDALKNEFNSLSNAMGEAIANGKIEQGSEQWNDMQSSILDVQTSIEDANKSLLEYQKNLRQLKWDTFDKTEEYIGKIQDESNFLIDLMSNQTLYDDKTGKDTKYATAIKGLHAVNYNAYMTQADDYAKEIQEIDKEMANDPYNKDLLERRQELLASQQEAIKNAEEEKQSIKSLVKDGYDAQLDALQKLIDKYKDSINSIKDLYDYQKNIKEQTDSLAALQKQREALGGDNSEETQSKLQQLDKQIADAKSDLQDTEYQQYLSDQEKLLDNFYSEAEEWINARLDDLDGLIQQEIDSTNANSAQINQTITDETQKVGYTITDQMKSIWNSSDGFTAVVSNYCNGFQNTATSILDAVNYIKGYVEQLKKKADAEAAEKARQAELARQQAAQKAAAAAAAQKQQQASSSSSSSGSSSSGSSGTWGSWFIHKADSYPKNRLKTETSIVDRLKYHDIDSSFARRKQYYEAMGGGSGYTGSSSQNRWLINQLKSHGYAKGTKSATKGIHLVGEDANEIGISKGQLVDFSGGETVFNGDMTKTLWKFADNPSDFMTNLVKVPTLPKLSSSANSSVDVGGVNIVMNGVNDVQTFSKQMREALADSAQTQKMFRTFVNKDSIEFKKYK